MTGLILVRVGERCDAGDVGIQVEVVARAPARLEVPRHAIGRDRLADALDRVPPAGLGLVVASAGSGKSVLLAQWEPTAPERHHCHLQLSASDADAVVCARHLLEELRRAAPSFPEGLETLVEAGGRALGEVFVDAVLTALAALDDGVLLVLDDLHRVAQAEVVEDLGRIVTGLPRNARAVVAARWDPVFSVRQVRLEGRLVEIRGAELAFEPSEGRDLVAAVVGSPVSDDQGAALVGRTEGWAAGLQMAAVAVTSAPDLTEAIATLAGDDRLVAEYLSAEVLDQQEPELRRFLLRTSVLEWLSAEVCDAVTGDGNGRRMLDEVARRSLFLVPLDRRGERYRYHHLFADLLRLRLRIEDPEGEVALHQAAATWLLSRDRFAEAVEHLLVAGDRDRALDLISREGHRLYERGESATLVRWMEALTQGPDDTPVVVSLNLLAAQVARDAASEATETYRRLSRRTDLSAEERATADAYFAVLVQCDLPPDEVRRAASAALDAIPSLDPLHMPEVLGLGGRDAVEALARFAAGQAAVMEGDSSAVGVLAELVSHPRPPVPDLEGQPPRLAQHHPGVARPPDDGRARRRGGPGDGARRGHPPPRGRSHGPPRLGLDRLRPGAGGRGRRAPPGGRGVHPPERPRQPPLPAAAGAGPPPGGGRGTVGRARRAAPGRRRRRSAPASTPPRPTGTKPACWCSSGATPRPRRSCAGAGSTPPCSPRGSTWPWPPAGSRRRDGWSTGGPSLPTTSGPRPCGRSGRRSCSRPRGSSAPPRRCCRTRSSGPSPRTCAAPSGACPAASACCAPSRAPAPAPSPRRSSTCRSARRRPAPRQRGWSNR